MEWKILAGVRFFLAWIVFCGHLHWFVPLERVLPLFWLFGKLDGFAAVFGFLLISGYSIAHSLIKQPEGFYKRRALRLYPLYAVSIFFSLIPFALLGSKIQSPSPEVFVVPSWQEVIGNLFFLQGYFSHPISSNAVLWTLSIEVLCYWLAPLFLKTSRKKLLFLIVVSSVAFSAYPLLDLPYYSYLQFGLGFVMLLWAWLLGFLYARDGKNWNGLKILIIVLGAALLGINGYVPVVSSLTYAASALILIYAPLIKLPKKVLNVLNYLGNISYPLYLFHTSALILGACFFHIRDQVGLTCFSLLVAIVFYHAIDVPLRVRKVHIQPSSSTS